MRLFAALPLPEPTHVPLARAAVALRREGWPVRWTDPSLLHVTLKFYGEVPVERARLLDDALAAAAAGTGPVPLRITRLGTLPGGRAARVIIAELARAPALERLQRRVEETSAAVGYAPEERPFLPHLTLARVKRGGQLPAAAHARLLREPAAVSATADAVALYESRSGPGGRRYVARRICRLVA